HLQSEEHKILNPSSIEDLDLELRLGDPPPKSLMLSHISIWSLQS
ncbi:hypothetical protein CISIN_1g0215562mg, partial [Citrus sinensis]